MNSDILSSAAKLSNQELLAQVQVLARREHEATADLIAHLAVLDERGLYLSEGCASLFTYLTQILHYSEHAAYNRMEVARAVRRFPVILEMLAAGSVNLTAVRLLAPILTPVNHLSLLASARYKRTEQVREIVAHARPQPPAASTIRRLPAIKTTPPSSSATSPVAHSSAHSLDLSTASSPQPPTVVPIAPERYKIQFTANAETRAKLQQVQDLLRHQIPDGDLGEIIDRALTLLLEEVLKEKCAATERPSVSRGVNGQSRHIPAEVKRAVWARDGGRCAYIAHSGRRCTERAFLEFHHVEPYAAKGSASVDNIQLRCRAHNVYEAELFGFSRPLPARKPPPRAGRVN